MPRPGWKATTAAAGCLPSLQAVASLRSAPCGLSSHHPSLRRPRWPTCPCSLPTRRHRELLKAGLPVLCVCPGLCGLPQPAVLPRVGILSAARDTPACTHTHTELSGAPWDGLMFSAGCVPRRPPLWAQSGHPPTSVTSLVRTRVLEALSLPVLRWPSPLGGGHGAAAAPVRAVPYVCSAQPTRSRRSLSAQPGRCLRGRGHS